MDYIFRDAVFVCRGYEGICPRESGSTERYFGNRSRMSTGDEIDQEGKKDVFQPKKVILSIWEIRTGGKLPAI